MKRKAAPRPEHDGQATPPELAIGKCCEVWAGSDTEFPAQISAYGNWTRAAHAWAAAHAVPFADLHLVLPPGAPWSVHQPGGVERLAGHGYSPDDVTWLRVAAQQHTTTTTTTTTTESRRTS